MPVFSYLTLLLDAAPAIPTPMLAAGLGMLIGTVGWLLNRTIAAFDNSVKESKEAMLTLSKAVEALGKEQTASRTLQGYLEKRIDTLEHKKEVLEKSFAAIDKLIAVKLVEKGGKES